jgi:hypothetical protein
VRHGVDELEAVEETLLRRESVVLVLQDVGVGGEAQRSDDRTREVVVLAPVLGVLAAAAREFTVRPWNAGSRASDMRTPTRAGLLRTAQDTAAPSITTRPGGVAPPCRCPPGDARMWLAPA